MYPVIFSKDKATESIVIVFPDFKNCFTSAECMLQAMTMAKNLLAMTLCELEERNMDIPKMTDLLEVNKTIDENSVASYIECDTRYYRSKHRSTCVKKTLTIPAWLNVMAEEKNLNFSSVLQEALKDKLGAHEFY